MIRQLSFSITKRSKKLQNNAFSFLVIYQRMQKKASYALYSVLCLIIIAEDFINVAFLVSFCATKTYKVSVAVNTRFQLPNWHDAIFGIFLLLQSISVSIFYELKLDFKLSFSVRIRFKIRKNNVMSVWQLATSTDLPWRSS